MDFSEVFKNSTMKIHENEDGTVGCEISQNDLDDLVEVASLTLEGSYDLAYKVMKDRYNRNRAQDRRKAMAITQKLEKIKLERLRKDSL